MISTGEGFIEEGKKEERNSFEDLWDEPARIFRDKSVLKISYIPKKRSEILHRDDVIKKLQRYLIDVKSGLSPNNIFIFGKPGTGKTLVTRIITKELYEMTIKKGIKLGIININCENARTENAIWMQINQQLMEIMGKNKQVLWNSRARHNIHFEQLYTEFKGLLIIVLDEIDKALDFNIINKLVRTISGFNEQSPCLICITNDVKFREYLMAHTLSVLAQNELQIDPYDAEQISDILKARSKVAFCPNALKEMVIPLCSAFSAQENGDARRAIDLLAKSGEIAEEKKKNFVDEDDVREANTKLDLDRVLSIVRTLPTQEKLTLYACVLLYKRGRQGNTITTGEIYNVYRQLCNHIDIDVLTQRRITDLLSELDMLGIINCVVVSKGRYGRTKEIHIEVYRETIRLTLLEDYRLKALEDFKTSVFAKMFDSNY